MPQIIRTPEQIFREEAKDIYLIRIKDGKGQKSSAWREIQKWLKTNLPNTKVEMLAASSYDGWDGYFGDLRVDFSEADLAIFCARWETTDGTGKCIDDRFQCYLYPYQMWYDKHACFIPTNKPPLGPGLTVWWHTPIGIIYHQFSLEEAEERQLTLHPSQPEDIWMHAVRLWPELASIDTNTLTSGGIQHMSAENKQWWLYNSHFDSVPFPHELRSEMLKWFHLEEDAIAY